MVEWLVEVVLVRCEELMRFGLVYQVRMVVVALEA